MELQHFVVGLIVAGAALSLAVRVWRRLTGKNTGGCGGCRGCGQPSVVSLEPRREP